MTDAGLTAIARLSPDSDPITVKGRLAWALLALVDAGEVGCKPLDQPGPRWSGYVHKLRTRHRLAIETVIEPHAGPFAGNHARYILRSQIEIVHRSDQGYERAAA